MTTQQLEERLVHLEQELGQVKRLLQQSLQQSPIGPQPEQPWWEKIAGTFPDDAAFDDAEEIGREWRRTYQDNFEPS
jgi:hypothetical protein